MQLQASKRQKNSCFVFDNSLFGRRKEEAQIEIGRDEERREGPMQVS